MQSTSKSDLHSVKARKRVGRSPSSPSTSPSGPTTFYLKTEKELEQGVPRGRRVVRRSSVADEERKMEVSQELEQGENDTPVGDVDSFGVQSLEETIKTTYSPENSLSRTTSASSTRSHDARAYISPDQRMNRVHPSIISTGHRIISSERGPTVAPPIHSHSIPRRRGSGTSSINMNPPLTPLRLSPHPESAIPGTPRSGSPKSFRLSDEESSVTDETNSQAILSSSSDEDPTRQTERTPQLVMPSLAMPIRRPFTEQGRQMGKAKIMLVGPKRVGKTSLIQSVFRSTEHIVHMDQLTPNILSQSSFSSHSSNYTSTTTFVEILASTRPYPSWWTDLERRTLHRRLSVGDGVLERNITFVDTPGLDSDTQVQQVLNQLNKSLSRTACMDTLSDSEVVGMLSGEGGVQVDAIIYLFDPVCYQSSDICLGLSTLHQELLRNISRWSNFIPVIARADTVTSDVLQERKQQIIDLLARLRVEPYRLIEPSSEEKNPEPLTVSSALVDDTEEVDASILMSSQYLQPLMPSELSLLVENMFSATNIVRMRHMAAAKFLRWRQETNPRKQQALQSPSLGYESRVTSAGSLVEDPSKVLVPHSSSSYYRSVSPGFSETSALSGNVLETSAFALAQYNEQAQPSEPYRQVRLAKWAQDLQRGLDNERRKHQQMYSKVPADWIAADGEKNDQALMAAGDALRPARGHLGGDLGVIDPRDPLGVLAFGQAFRRRGFLVLQVAGGCGLLGAVAYWVVRNWLDIQELCGFGQHVGIVNTLALPAPTTRSVFSTWLDDLFQWGG